jgi:7,8-dihydropterin-6-yl-methyl-4-(beta-D-ribofuranosyl)aminobenzene 5'-phosphate synthase
MNLKVIVDNNTYIDQYYCGEPAVSFFIEDDDTQLLLDVGYSDLFLKNLEQLNININNIDTIVISHGHNDHTRGLKYLFNNVTKKRFKIVSHPQAFEPKLFNDEMIGSPLTKNELLNLSSLKLSSIPIKVSKNITFLGEIPQENTFETRKKIGKIQSNGKLLDDYILDDSALVYKGKKGIYIISGCSHSGICNIIEYAKKVTKCDNVIGVIGGFHLFNVDNQVKETINYLQKNKIKKLYPCHCTSFKVKAAINNELDVQEVGVGLSLIWN